MRLLMDILYFNLSKVNHNNCVFKKQSTFIHINLRFIVWTLFNYTEVNVVTVLSKMNILN